eukprot:m.94036 g.94036  ORF g.94036 m.94036 type:complete len:455 (+) comp15109_c0_seq5:122-1486(+)
MAASMEAATAAAATAASTEAGAQAVAVAAGIGSVPFAGAAGAMAASGQVGWAVRNIHRMVWKCPRYYDGFNMIGCGSFGSVCEACRADGIRVAVKKLQDPFQSVPHAQRAFREIRLLKYMQHENIIAMVDLFRSSAPEVGSPADEVYIVTELMASDLRRVMDAQLLSDSHAQLLVYQVVRGLKYLHSAGIVHRDLSPSNIAVDKSCDVKIIDFGLARSFSPDGMTGYIQKKWYRAPEVILTWGDYTEKVDMWSLGTILAELITGSPLFPARAHPEHINMIVALLGRPSDDYIASVKSDEIRFYLQHSLPNYQRQSFEAYFRPLRPDANPLALDLLENLLVFEPTLRPAASLALTHPYFAAYHVPDDEPTAAMPFDDSFEQLQLDAEGWKGLVLQEVEQFRMERPELRQLEAFAAAQPPSHEEHDIQAPWTDSDTQAARMAAAAAAAATTGQPLS